MANEFQKFFYNLFFIIILILLYFTLKEYLYSIYQYLLLPFALDIQINWFALNCLTTYSDLIPRTKNKSLCSKKELQKEEFFYYLSGLIEGDGYITITNNRVILGITFHIKDKPLAEYILIILGQGTIVKRKSHSVELRFSAKSTLLKIILGVNGKFRTPKISKLHNLIYWMNKNHGTDIKPLPLDSSDLFDHSWLAGFIDSDGHFYIKLNSIHCKFALEQQMYYKINKTEERSNEPFLRKICDCFGVQLFIRTRINYKKSSYLIRIENQISNSILIKYLNIHPLKSSKHLDFCDWKQCFELIINKKHLTMEGKIHVKYLKEKMNSKRMYFNWDHLENENAVYFSNKINNDLAICV